jgi:2,4-dienoyl-CoA reductase-like NADH-dependent reductase (Old Yellow Enzyme family)
LAIYQAPFAEAIKKASGIAVLPVGMIVDSYQAKAIVAEGRIDRAALARGSLDDLHWARHTDDLLGAEVACLP